MMDGLIGLLILMGAIFYSRLRLDARKQAQTRQRNKAAQVKFTKPVKASQPNRRQDNYGNLTKRLQTMATALQSGEGFDALGDKEKRPQAANKTSRQISRYSQAGSAERAMPAGVNPGRPKTGTSAMEQELQSTAKRAGLTFAEETIVLEEEALALQQTYNQLGNVFDEAIDELVADSADYATMQPQLGKVTRPGKKTKPLVTTNIQDVKNGIIMANVLERPYKRQAPAYIRRKGV